MVEKIFPKQFDNVYRGQWLGPGLFAFVIAVKALQSFGSLLNTREVMIAADGIPLGAFAPAAAREAIVMFALLGMYGLIVPLLGLLALIRYRAMVPLLILVLLATQLGGRLVNLAHPTTSAGASGGTPFGFYINTGLILVTILALGLSIVSRKARGALEIA
ncbi:MAG: hypothetical protein ACRED9_10050 [Caulobacteraceae bacterium]